MPIQFVDIDRPAAQPITAFASTGACSVALAHGDGASHAYVIHFEPRGCIGPHPAGFDQLFIVARGEGWVAGADGERHCVGVERAAFIPKGEVHSKGSESGMVAIMVQAGRFQLAQGEP